MGMYPFDLQVQSILQFGLDEIRKNNTILDEIFEDFKAPHLNALYGTKEIDSVREWFIRTNIPVVLGFGLDDTRIPCFSVHLSSSQEDVSNAFLNDFAGEETEAVHPRVIIPSFVPTSYDESAGIITAADSIDVTIVTPGHYIADANDNKYEISDITGQVITVELDSIPDFSKVQVESFINTNTYKRGEIYFQDTLDIGVHARSDPNQVVYLYSILSYILLKYKAEISDRCIDLITWSASDFNRDSQYIAENVFSRWVRLSGRTRRSWKDDKFDKIDTIDVDVTEE